MEDQRNKEAHLIGSLIDCISAESDRDYLVRVPSGDASWNQARPPPNYPLADGAVPNGTVDFVFAPPPPPYHVKYPSYCPTFEEPAPMSRRSSEDYSGSGLSLTSENVLTNEDRWDSLYTPFGPTRMTKPVSSVVREGIKARLGSTTSSAGSGSPSLSHQNKGKSYRDAVSRQLPSLSASQSSAIDQNAAQRSSSLFARSPTGSDSARRSSFAFSNSDSPSATPPSEHGRSSPNYVGLGFLVSSKYGLDTFGDELENEEFDSKTEAVFVGDDEKFNLVGFISKGPVEEKERMAETKDGANISKKNASSETSSFKKISSRKKSRLESPQDASKGESNKKQSQQSKQRPGNAKNVDAGLLHAGAVDSQDPLVQSRFSVLRSKVKTASLGVEAQTDGLGQNLAGSGDDDEDGPEFVLNNDRRWTTSLRSSSATRTAYINNDFNSTENENLETELEQSRRKDKTAGETNFTGRTAAVGGNAGKSGANSGKGKGRDAGEANRKKRKQNNSEMTCWLEYCVNASMQWMKAAVLWIVALLWDIVCQLWDITAHCFNSMFAKVSIWFVWLWLGFVNLWRTVLDRIRKKHLWSWKRKGNVDQLGLEENIGLPATGDEAMSRLLSCKGEDAYSILGLRADCTDEDIKRFYRHQARLVHPDKNSAYGADEAFKILGHAFELIGTPDRRQKYNVENMHRSKVVRDFEDLLTQLRDKMEEALNTMHCDCGCKHRRFKTERSISDARYCRKCREHHCAREGDIWAESKWCGFYWNFFACMDGSVFNITEWASCAKNNLKHMKANTHLVQYRLITGRNRQQNGHSNTSASNTNAQHSQRGQQQRLPNDTDIEDFLKKLYQDKFAPASAGSQVGGAGGTDFVQSQFNPPPSQDLKKAGRRRKTRN